MKIGVGVTTNGKEWPGAKFCEPIYCTDQNTIANDKNKLIKQLYDEGCDYIFLFDDDCFPIKEGWEQFFIGKAEHLVLCNPKHNTLTSDTGKLSLYSTGTGCMIFITRKCVDTVGYFNPAYGKYGYEHCGYSLRINKSGLTPSWYVSANGWEEYIYSWDLQGDAHGFVKVHARTEQERSALIAANESEWQREQSSNKIYYGM